jgi:hypothetical protein
LEVLKTVKVIHGEDLRARAIMVLQKTRIKPNRAPKRTKGPRKPRRNLNHCYSIAEGRSIRNVLKR